MQRRHKDPLTNRYHCNSCEESFISAQVRNHHEKVYCKMSELTESASKKNTARLDKLTTKLIEDYKTLKEEGVNADHISSLLKRSVEPIDVPAVRARLEKLISNDHSQIQLVRDTVRVKMNEPRIYDKRPDIIGDTEEDEIKYLNGLKDYTKIQEALKKYRVACMVLESNSIRFSPLTEYRQKVLEIMNDFMPKIERSASDF
jgi:hypothetical protein